MQFTLAFSLQDQLDNYSLFLIGALFLGLAAMAILQFAQARELKQMLEYSELELDQIRAFESRMVDQEETTRRLELRLLSQPVVAKPEVAKPETALAGKVGQPHPPRAVPLASDPEQTVVSSLPDVESNETPDRDEIAGLPTQAHTPLIEPATASAKTAVPASGSDDLDDYSQSDANESEDDTGEYLADMQRDRLTRATTRSHLSSKQRPPASALRSSTQAPPTRNRPSSKSRGSESQGPRRLITLIVSLLVGIVAVVGAYNWLKPDSPKSEQKPTQRTKSPSRKSPAATPLNKSEVTVAVFNGTTINGLASTISSQLQQAGYQGGATGTHPDQSHTSTSVLYASGMQRAAEDVARRLKASDIRPIDTESQALAGSAAKVLVIVGADHSP